MLLEYADKDTAAATEEHTEIVQLRTDLIDVLELDCNERLLIQMLNYLSKAKLLTICAESGPKGHFLGKLFFSPPPCRII